MIDKSAARKISSYKRNLLSEVEIAEKAKLICDKITQLENYRSADNILAYYRYGKEVDLKYLYEKAADDGKRVFLPRVKGRDMDFYPYTGSESIREGYKGIKEPISEAAFIPDSDMSILMIMPGLAFDRKLGRAGYGGGFYDRYLDRFKDAYIAKAAVAYSIQILEDEIALNELDIRPEMIITENEIICG